MLKYSNVKMKKRAFTLIELLVVIAILGLIGSVVFVSLKGVKDRAKIANVLQYSSTIRKALAADIAGEWSFDDCTAKDTSGNGNNGTITGTTCTDDTPYKMIGQGVGRKALSFDGNDYVEIPYSSSLNLPADNETVMLWVKHNNSSNIFFQGAGWSRRLFGPYWTFTDAGGIYYNLSAEGSTDNKWHLVGYTISGKTINSYVDGKLMQTVITANNIDSAATSYWRFGRLCGGASCDLYYTGLIDEVRIYSRALTQAEIQKHYAEGAQKRGLAKNF